MCPFGAANTTLAVAPPAAACGNLRVSWSIACWDELPGMVNESVVVPDRVAAPTAAATSSISHAATTRRLRRNESRPRR